MTFISLFDFFSSFRIAEPIRALVRGRVRVKAKTIRVVVLVENTTVAAYDHTNEDAN